MTLADDEPAQAAGGPFTFDIAVNPVNDAPALTTNAGATVDEGGLVAIGAALLEATDVDEAAGGDDESGPVAS